MNREARYIVSLGLSLTFIMATALFLLVGVNPKDSATNDRKGAISSSGEGARG